MILPTNTVSPEWMNENTLRAYPLSDDCPAASSIPACLIADLRVSVNAVYDSVFVSSVYVSDTIVSVGISGVRAGGSVFGLLTKTLTRDELEPYAAYSMDTLSDEAAGDIAFGDISQLTGTTKLTFSSEDAQIVTSAIQRITAPGVTAIVDPAFGVEADGIIDLSGNSEFRTYLDSDGQTIVIELTDMYRDMTTSACDATPSFDKCGAIPVKTVNGVEPTSDGVITLRFR